MAKAKNVLMVGLVLFMAPLALAADSAANDWMSGETLTGDWGGLRTDLAEKGITFDIDATMIFQNNAHGGANTTNAMRLSGSNDIEIGLDFGKMGLWEGGSLLLHAESKWGGGIDKKVQSLIPTNFDAAKPLSAEQGFGLDEGAVFLLSEIIYTQVLCDGKLILLGGKLWGARAFDTNVFANDEESQFLNAGLRNNMIIPAFLPYTNWGVGAIVNPTDWLSVMTAVADTNGRAKTTGFETAFHGDTNYTIIHEWAFKVKPFGLDGNQRFGAVWSCMSYPDLDQSSPPLSGNSTDMSNTNCGVYYNFDQYVYQEEADPTQGLGLFGRFGYARGDVNAINYFYSIGVGGQGIIPDRDKDTFGLGYTHSNLSNDMPAPFHSEQAVEVYYNIEVFPWLHISPDLQFVVNPGGTDANDVAVVWGMRMHMQL